MKRAIHSMLTAAMAGVMLVGIVSCGRSSEEPVETTTDLYANPEQYITVPELSTITLSQAELDESLQEQIDSILEQSREEKFKEIDAAAQNGDRVNIYYVGKAADESVTLSEETLAGMNNKSYDDKGNLKEGSDLILGSGSFIGEYTDKDGNKTPGFEKQIEGMKKGETKDITVIFPDNYSNDATLRGVKVIFTITVNTVSRMTVDQKSTVGIDYDFIGTSEDGLFKGGSFTIDYTAEADDDANFHDIFKISEVRDKFIGLDKYSEYEYTFTVPTDVNDTYKDYAGKTITVVFTVDSVTTIPEWNDAFVNNYTRGTYTAATAYEQALADSIKNNEAYSALLSASSVMTYPEEALKTVTNDYIVQMVGNTSGKSTDGLSEGEIKALVDEETYEWISTSANEQAKASVKERLIYEYLFNELGITLSSQEYNEELEAYYNDHVVPNQYYFYYYYGVTFTSKEDVEDYYGKEELEVQFKASKMMEMLGDYVTITD